MLSHETRSFRITIARPSISCSVFPSEVDLSASPYSLQVANNELDIIVVPCVYQYELGGKKWTTTGAWLSWKVSIIEAEKHVVKARNSVIRGNALLLHRYGLRTTLLKCLKPHMFH
jgi:ABC-type anion transport system duplicated permease subunit